MAGIDVALNRRQLLLTNIESLAGQDSSPSEATSGHAIRLLEPFTLDLSQELLEQQGLASLGYSRPFGTVRPMGVTFRTMIVGYGSSYTASIKPPVSNLLRACGLKESFVSSNALGRPAYQYSPTSRVQSMDTVSIVPHVDGYDHRMVGAMGNVNLVWVAATPVIGEFNMRGQLTTEASTARGSAVGIPTASPPRWVGSGSIFMQSLSAVIENLNFNTNNTVFEQRASNAASGSGIMKILITERKPGGSLDPEATNATSYDWVNVFRTSSGAILRAQAGNTVGNTLSLVASQAVIKTLARQDKSGLATFGVGFECYEINADDQFVLEFS